MADLKISDLSALSGSDLVAADELAIVDDSASETKKITVSNLIANGVTLISDDAIPGAKILFGAGDIATAALADSAVTSAKIGADQVTAAKIADNTIVNLVSDLPTSGDYTGQLALDTDDNSLYVYSGSAWLNTKAPGSVNAFTDTTSGIINISTVVSSGTATITASIDNTASAAQFLAGPVGSGGTVGYRTIDGGDLPAATTTSKGGVIVNGGGLTVSTDTIQIDNSVTASSVKHLVTYDANGLINGGSAISSSDLPVATTSAKGAVIASDGLAVDANGNLSIDNTITAGTYTKVTVTSKGVVSAGDVLTAADIPDHSAAKLTSGTIDSSRIASDAITAAKLADQSTVKFGGALGSDNVTIFPDGDFKGQLFWDETSLDLYVYTGSAFIPITVLSGNLVNAGTYNANTNLVSSVTTAGSSAGFSAGSALPAPTGANLNHYLVVDTSGTGSGAAPAVALAPPDMLLSNGVGTEYRLIDVSNAIAGQTAANISFIASGTIAATDVQAALQEVDTEKLAKAGGTMTGDLNFGTSTNVVFEGSSADDFETTLTVTDPTADRTITLPNVTGTVVTTGDTGSVTSTMITDGTIVNADINASAEIAVSKLANGTARQLLQTDSGGTGVEFTSNVDVPGTLDVTSAATFDSTVAVTGLLSANGNLAYPAGSASAVSLYAGSDTDTGIYSPGSNQFGIATAGTPRIVVDASGNVGVGETSPTDKLHIATSSNDDGILVKTTGNNSNALDFDANRSGANNAIASIRGRWNGTTVGQISFVSGGDTTNKNDGVITFGTEATASSGNANASEKMRIDSSGRLLIGTTASPSGGDAHSQNASLLIRGRIGNSGDSGRINLQRGSAASNDSSIGTITFTDSSNNAYSRISVEADAAPGSDDYPGRIVFSTTGDGLASPTPRMQISNDGTTAVYGNGNAIVAASNQAAGSTFKLFTGKHSASSTTTGTESFAVYTNGSATFADTVSSGSSSRRGQFLGTCPSSVTASSADAFVAEYNGTTVTRIKYDGSAAFGGDLSINDSSFIRVRQTGDNTSTAIQLSHDGTGTFTSTVTSSGVVTDNGQVKTFLSSGDGGLFIYDSTDLNNPTTIINKDGSVTFDKGVTAESAAFGTSSLGSTTITATNDSANATIHAQNHTGTGKVFSGFDSPGNETSTIFARGNAEFTQAASDLSGGAALKATGTAYGTNKAIHAYINSTNSARSLIFAENAVGTVLNVQANGVSAFSSDVGIGTTSPTSISNYTSFTLNGTTGGNIEFKDDETLKGSLYNTATEFILQAQGSTTPLTFRTNSSERMRIDHDGNVGINVTPSGSSKLQVGGSMRFANSGAANDSTNPIIYRVSGEDSLAFASGNSERMRIASTGLLSVPGVYSFTTASSANVIVESAGQLSRATSSAKYKRNVETLEDSYADAILNCRPVWYQSKSELDNPNHGFWGFIAEEVAEIDPRLVQWKTNEITYDENGSVVAIPCEPEAESVAYDRFVPHLLNIIKRQQTAIENLEAKVAALEAG